MRFFMTVFIVAFTSLLVCTRAQNYETNTGEIAIFSETPLFIIDGVNHKVASTFNTKTGEVKASTLVRSFQFEEALVEEHFNESYLEPDKFPQATFEGKILEANSIDYTTLGVYPITVVGNLTMHGETREISEPGKLIVKKDGIKAKTEFDVSLEDYKIAVESSYKHAIKDEVRLKIKFDYHQVK